MKMVSKYLWILFFSFVSRLHAACTSKITFKNKVDDVEGHQAYFMTQSDNVELDAKLFCSKFSVSTEACNTVVSYHPENCMADEEFHKTMAFYAPDDCYTLGQCFMNRYMNLDNHTMIDQVRAHDHFNANSLLHDVTLNNELLLKLYRVQSDQMVLSIPNIKEIDVCGIDNQEAFFLYSLAYQTSGFVLEEGSYCGCSTTFLAAGVRNRRQVLGDEEKRTFITSDTFAAGIDSISPNGYQKLQGGKVGLQVWGQNVEGFDFPESEYLQFFSKVLSPSSKYGGSMLNCLYTQLYGNKVHEYVTIVAGSSKSVPRMPFRLIFSDAAHDHGEIATNADNWIANVQEFKRHRTQMQSSDTMIFVFHDVAVSKLDLIGQINAIFAPLCKSFSAVTYMSIYAIELFF